MLEGQALVVPCGSYVDSDCLLVAFSESPTTVIFPLATHTCLIAGLSPRSQGGAGGYTYQRVWPLEAAGRLVGEAEGSTTQWVISGSNLHPCPKRELFPLVAATMVVKKSLTASANG